VFDWSGFERWLTGAVVQTVSATVAANPDERFYAAALHMLYRDTKA
jgi:hypothetical protein